LITAKYITRKNVIKEEEEEEEMGHFEKKERFARASVSFFEMNFCLLWRR
jgi:hypothetical protein